MRPAVSVEVSGLSAGDMGFALGFQHHLPIDNDKPLDESLFDFDQFPDPSTGCSLEPSHGLLDNDVCFSTDLFGNHESGFGLFDQFDAKYPDLQTAPGATHVSDGALAADH